MLACKSNQTTTFEHEFSTFEAQLYLLLLTSKEQDSQFYTCKEQSEYRNLHNISRLSMANESCLWMFSSEQCSQDKLSIYC
ncbi:hypothetical protein Csa_009306 [Cucumis sativus]|nr:hypothetical protein Csa_009306 [Cucumis sativus]